MMTSDSSFLPRRRQEVLSRVRQRQALRKPQSKEEILEEERKIFAEDDEYIPQLLRNYAQMLGENPLTLIPQEELGDVASAPVSPIPNFQKTALPPIRQRDSILEPPIVVHNELTEFDRHHNAVRMYVIQQFQEGKKSREIADMIGLTPHKLSRWYNLVKDLPTTMQLWTPLFKEEEVGEWDSSSSETEEEIPVVEPEVSRQAPRLREPSPEAVRAAKIALRQAAKNSQIVRDQEAIQLWIAQNLSPAEDSTVGNRLAALAFHRDDWSLSRIARALELDVSTVSRWMTRAKQAEQAEVALQKGMDQRRAELRQKAEIRQKAAPTTRRQPRPKVALPRPILPLSPMAKRSVGILKVVLELAETDGQGILSLPVASAMERERIMAILSMLDVQPHRPMANGKGFLIPLPPEETEFLTRTLAQS